jgi:hypothetical protein
MKKYFKIIFTVLFSSINFLSLSQISGIAYKDYNASGTRDNTVGTLVEPLVAGITVKAYSATDILLATTTTNSSGAYSFTGLTLPVRLEFSGLPSSYLPGCATDNLGITGSSVQFISAATTTADFRINNPDNYSQANPMVIRGQNYIGPYTNNAGDGAFNGSYYNVGQILDPVVNGNTIKEFSSNPAVGATYGLAYSRKSKTLYAAAVIRNYFGTKIDATNSDGGFDDIHTFTFSDPNPVFPPSASTATLTQGASIDLSVLGVPMGTDPRPTTITGSNPYTDNATLYQKVGKIGIGDIDMSSDGDTLYVVNLNEAAPSLVIINVTTPATPVLISNVAMPNPGCTNGTFRPWAVKYFEGHAYIGGVCDAGTGTAADLQAYVYRYDGGSTFTQVATMPLNYTRGKVTFRADGTNQNANWRPWTDTWAPALLSLGPDLAAQPQPMLMDIEFTEDGSMILGFGDRFTYQSAHGQRAYNVTTGSTFFSTVSAGDVIKLCNISGSFVLENTGISCTQGNTDNGSATTLNPINPPAFLKEFFDDDYYNTGSSSTGQAGHSETALGALAVLAGRNQLMATTFDPISTNAPGGTSGEVNTSGVRFYNSDNGNQVPVSGVTSHKGWIDFDQTFTGSNRKGGNMGDIELLCDAAPIEIGNRIWNDANANGIQDPGEAVFTNVTVELYLDANNDCIPDGAALATVTTDANGQYAFSNQITTEYVAGDPGFGHVKFNISQLVSKQHYIIRIGSADWNSSIGQGIGDLAGYHLTTQNVVGNGIADWSDSDASIVNIGGDQYAQICLTTGILGENNHTYDFGLKNTIQLCGLVWNDLDGDAPTVGSPEGPTEQVINGTNIGGGITTGQVLYANLIDASNNVIGTTPIATDGSYCFPLVPANTTGLTVQLTTNQGTVGQPKPATAIPAGWMTTGENKNGQGGGPDPGANSEIPITTVISNITQQNFGIQQRPESAVNLQPSQPNPGGSTSVVVPCGAFQTSNVGVNPNSQDYNGGTVQSIRITSFPTNINTIIINGIPYTSGTWPALGVTIPYTNGVCPNWTIEIDPIDGNVTSVIPFVTIDDAGAEDLTPGSVTLPFTSTLPIKLESFNLRMVGCDDALFTWRVSDAVNFSRFELQISTDGNKFEPMTSIPYTPGIETYSFSASNMARGIYQYRLKMVDFDGKFAYSNISLLNSNCGSSVIAVFPNPATTEIFISNFKNGEVVTVQVFDINGKLALNNVMPGDNIIKVSIAGLPKGTYLLKAMSKSNFVNQKIVIQ